MTDHQHRLTAAREAVVEAAERYERIPLTNFISVANAEFELRSAAANLRAAKKEAGGE